MPFYRFEIAAGMSPDKVAQRIRSVTCVEPKLFDGLARRASNLFWGSVRGDSFRLQRNITYRNSFLPQIRGRVTQSGAGSNLRVVMFMHPAVAVFMVFWLCMVAGLAMGPLNRVPFLPWTMLGFGLVIPGAAFFLEAVKARKLIYSLVREGTPQPIR